MKIKIAIISFLNIIIFSLVICMEEKQKLNLPDSDFIQVKQLNKKACQKCFNLCLSSNELSSETAQKLFACQELDHKKRKDKHFLLLLSQLTSVDKKQRGKKISDLLSIPHEFIETNTSYDVARAIKKYIDYHDIYKSIINLKLTETFNIAPCLFQAATFLLDKSIQSYKNRILFSTQPANSNSQKLVNKEPLKTNPFLNPQPTENEAYRYEQALSLLEKIIAHKDAPGDTFQLKYLLDSDTEFEKSMITYNIAQNKWKALQELFEGYNITTYEQNQILSSIKLKKTTNNTTQRIIFINEKSFSDELKNIIQNTVPLFNIPVSISIEISEKLGETINASSMLTIKNDKQPASAKILLNQSLVQTPLDRSEIYYNIAHECAHIFQRDSLTNYSLSEFLHKGGTILAKIDPSIDKLGSHYDKAGSSYSLAIFNTATEAGADQLGHIMFKNDYAASFSIYSYRKDICNQSKNPKKLFDPSYPSKYERFISAKKIILLHTLCLLGKNIYPSVGGEIDRKHSSFAEIIFRPRKKS